MPPETATETETAPVAQTVAPLVSRPSRDPANGWFVKGCPPGPGRPKGQAKAMALLDHSAPSLLKHSIHRATVGKRDAVLNKLLDKIVPDAGVGVSATVGMSLIDGLRQLAERTRRREIVVASSEGAADAIEKSSN